MKIDQVLKYFGSQIAAAEALGVQQPTISNWKSRGRIPLVQQLRLEQITGGKLKAQPLMPSRGKKTVSRV